MGIAISQFATWLLIVLISWSAPAWSIELYKYVNEDGVVVLDSQIPPRYVRTGYTVLSSDGRVLRVVERALSKQELEEQAARRAAEQKFEEEKAAREAYDATLMRLYSTPEDVNRARDTKIATIESFIESSRSNLFRLNSQRRQYESRAADVERAGGIITKENVDIIQSLAARIQQTELEIHGKMQEIANLNAAYDKDLQRVNELYGLP